MISQSCPCGCALQLSPYDLQREYWLFAIAGPDIGAHINLSTTPCVDLRYGADEPMSTLRCRCGADVELATYLAEFLDRWGMGKPTCVRCWSHEKARSA